MSARSSEADHLLTPSEVAALFRVDPKTVTRWAKAGKLTSIRTLGGHRRYRASEVHALLESHAPARAFEGSESD
jgi:excisionase family DNA binding protein